MQILKARPADGAARAAAAVESTRAGAPAVFLARACQTGCLSRLCEGSRPLHDMHLGGWRPAAGVGATPPPARGPQLANGSPGCTSGCENRAALQVRRACSPRPRGRGAGCGCARTRCSCARPPCAAGAAGRSARAPNTHAAHAQATRAARRGTMGHQPPGTQRGVGRQGGVPHATGPATPCRDDGGRTGSNSPGTGRGRGGRQSPEQQRAQHGWRQGQRQQQQQRQTPANQQQQQRQQAAGPQHQQQQPRRSPGQPEEQDTACAFATVHEAAAMWRAHQQQQASGGGAMLSPAQLASLVAQLEVLATGSGDSSSGSGLAGSSGGSSSSNSSSIQLRLPLAEAQELRLLVPQVAAAAAAVAADMAPCAWAATVRALTTLPGSSSGAALSAAVEAGRPKLGALTMGEQAALASSLAAVGVRPSNAWFGAFLMEAQVKLPDGGLDDLAALLGAIAALGVVPSRSWIVGLSAAALDALCAAQPAAAAAAAASRPLTRATDAATSDGERAAATGAVRLLGALAAARQPPEPRLAAALLAAARAEFARLSTWQLTDLLVALGELQVAPPPAWLGAYLDATAARLQVDGDCSSGAYGPRELAASVAALGALQRTAALRGAPRAWQAPEQAAAAAAAAAALEARCGAWVSAALAAASAQLPAFGARDLAALLSGLACLPPGAAPGAAALAAILAETGAKLGRFDAHGLAALLEAVTALAEVQQAQRQQLQQSPALAEGEPDRAAYVDPSWLAAYFSIVSSKLPVFSGADLLCVLRALALASSGGSGALAVRLPQGWLPAALTALAGRCSVLDVRALADALDAAAALTSQHGADAEAAALAAAAAAAAASASPDDAARDPPALLRLLRRMHAFGAPPPSRWAAAVAASLAQQRQLVQALGDEMGGGGRGDDSVGTLEECERLLLVQAGAPL